MRQGLFLSLFIVSFLLFGCSEGEKKHYSSTGMNVHFDLSEFAGVTDKPLYLHAQGRSYPLTAHHEDSLEDLADESDLLQLADKERVTHFAAGVALESGRMNHIHITAGDPYTDPEHKLLLWSHHLQPAAENTGLKSAFSMGDNHTYTCAVSAAVSMVFNHPELVTSDPAKAAIIMHHIDPVASADLCSKNATHRQEIIDLATALVAANKKYGSSVTNEPLTVYAAKAPADPAQQKVYWTPVTEGNENPDLVMYTDGKPYYVYKFTDDDEPAPLLYEGDITKLSPAVQYVFRPEVLEAARAAVLRVLRETKNDPALAGVKYTVIEGDGPVAGAATVEEPGMASLKLRADAVDEKIALSYAGGIDGMSIRLDGGMTTGADGFRYTTIKVKNYYLRHGALWVKWLKPDGTYDNWWSKGYDGILEFYDSFGMSPFYEWFHDMSQTDGSVFFGFIGTRTVIMGIPESPDWSYYKIMLPPSSSAAELIFASMGTGRYQNENIVPTVITSIIDIGIPAYFLFSGVWEGPEGAPILKDAVTNPKVLAAIASAGLALNLYSASGGGGTDYTAFGKAFGAILFNAGCDRLRYAIVKMAATSKAEGAIPFIGWGLYLAGLAANYSQLVQTTAEVASTPATHKNGLVATWSTKVRITPDPLNIRGGFPEAATDFAAKLFFGDHQAASFSGTIPNTAVPYLDFSFTDIPEGGKATYKIDLLYDGRVVVGHVDGTVQNDAKSSPPNAEGVNHTFQLTENMVDITGSTVYEHKDKIAIDANGDHVWLGYGDTGGHYVAPAAPEATVADLPCSSSGASLCSLFDITLNLKGHSVGYAWQAYTENTPVCGAGTSSSGQRMFLQNLSVLNNGAGGPESLHVESPCGYLEYRPAIAYDFMGAVDGHHVFLDPQTKAGVTTHYVRKIAINQTLSFASGTTAIGRLNLPPSDIAVHPSGILISVSREKGKMEILDLKNDPVPQDDAPLATPVLGIGDREGLIDNPVAVAVTGKGDILILEQGNSRVSAFDATGAVRSIFGPEGGKTNSFPLSQEFADRQLLDIDVESTGLVFVLSYRSGGKSREDYFVEIYGVDGTLIDTVEGVAAARMAVDHFRNIFTLNYEYTEGPRKTYEPTISLWNPIPQ